MAASGLFDGADILEELRSQGFLGKRDKRISANGLHGILHNPIYAGRIVCEPWGIDAPTSFEALVDEETFAKAQLHLSESPPAGHRLPPEQPRLPAAPLRALRHLREAADRRLDARAH
jgi:hypothetical protein